ncbi:MAG: hypothetical protein M3N31_07115 [Actinomycetota bacterium]|nr:hypothetical protein [Actinomycetota bacterium]
MLLLATAYAVNAVLPDGVRDRFPTLAGALFGFDQLRPLGWAALMVPLGAGAALHAGWHGLEPDLEALRGLVEGVTSRTRALLTLGAGAYSFLWFLGLRSNFVNPDGGAFSAKFHADVPVRGATVSHDEMLELYVHSRFWHHTSRAFGWSVEYSYQFLSALAGAVFVVVLVVLARLLLGDRRWAVLVLGVGSAGFMQLFFGDVENYTLVTLLMLVYFLTGYLFLEGRVGVVVPSAVLAVAVTFHLLAAFLLLSLAYLYVVALRRGQWWSLAAGVTALVAIPVAVVVYFHHHGLPLEVIRTSNAFGQAGGLQRFASPDVGYHAQIVSLVFLLFPPVLCVVPLALYRRIARTPFNIFMVLATLVFLAYVFIWRADLGVYNDWNLYAPAALPLAILFWHNFARAEGMVNKAGIGVALTLTSAIHSYAWILRNHL